ARFFFQRLDYGGVFISQTIGSVIPMLFAPVPSTQLFEKYRDYYASRGWCERDGTVRDFHLLNGKIFPFLKMNEGSVSDYVNLQRMIFMLNENYRGQSFNPFGDGAVSTAFRQIVGTTKEAKGEANHSEVRFV